MIVFHCSMYMLSKQSLSEFSNTRSNIIFDLLQLYPKLHSLCLLYGLKKKQIFGSNIEANFKLFVFAEYESHWEIIVFNKRF